MGVGAHASDVGPDPVVTSHTIVADPTAQANNQFISEQFGVAFSYPTDYEIATEHGTLADGVIVLLRAEDVATPEPPIIFIGFSEKPQQSSLENMRNGELQLWVTKEHPDTIVAGQRALDFDTQGYYERREQMFVTPDGRYVIRISASYLQEDGGNEPLVTAAQVIRDSWEWR